MAGPLSGIRIIDLTRLYPGPFGTQLLGDLGAEVIKVEDKNSPDTIRFYPPVYVKEGAGYISVNRNKKSLALDLRSDKGKEIFFKLVEKSDVVVEQYRPGVLDKMGLGYEKGKSVNPRIIYCSITGFGQTGPYAKIPGHDLNYMGLAGISDIIGSKGGDPAIPGIQVADVAGGGLMSVIGILSAIIARKTTGKGQYVDISMFDGILPFVGMVFSYLNAGGQSQERGDMFLSGSLICYNIYRTKDGRHMTLGALEIKFWEKFCNLIGKPEWLNKQFIQGEERDQIHAELSKICLTRTHQEWVDILKGQETMCEPVMKVDELEKNPHAIARNMIVEYDHPTEGKIKSIGIPIKFSDTKADKITPPPVLGQHNDEILELIGYDHAQTDKLRKEGIIV
jgi:crotonobetainyl-CoA:carnitine CoA-transferase CaiB-like acyl-CoA transferase